MQASHSEDITEKALWISLSQIHGIGSQTFCLLLKTFGSPANIYAAKRNQLAEVVSDKIASTISQGVDDIRSDPASVQCGAIRW